MEVYNADEQLKILEQWWRENWMAIAVGLVLGVALIGSWIGWQEYGDRNAENASVVFEQLQRSLRSEDLRGADEHMGRLRSQYARTPYAVLGSLALAAELVDRKDAKAAIGHLQWAASYGKDSKLRRIAVLRKARLLWSQGDADGALAALKIKDKDPFAPLYAELRGDILLSQGKRAEARAAYQTALDTSPENGSRAQVQQKLDDLADVPPATPAAKS